MNIRQNKGITLVVLITTVIVMIMIAGVTVVVASNWINKSQSIKLQSEIMIVKQAISERYMKYLTIKDASILVGDNSKTTQYSLIGITLDSNYYELSKTDMKNLNLDNITDTYIVNYKTQEVINKTQIESNNTSICEIYLEGNK